MRGFWQECAGLLGRPAFLKSSVPWIIYQVHALSGMATQTRNFFRACFESWPLAVAMATAVSGFLSPLLVTVCDNNCCVLCGPLRPVCRHYLHRYIELRQAARQDSCWQVPLAPYLAASRPRVENPRLGGGGAVNKEAVDSARQSSFNSYSRTGELSMLTSSRCSSDFDRSLCFFPRGPSLSGSEMSYSPSLGHQQGTGPLKRVPSSSNTPIAANYRRSASTSSPPPSYASSPSGSPYQGPSRMSSSSNNAEQQVPLMAGSGANDLNDAEQVDGSGKPGFRMVGMGEDDARGSSVNAGASSKAGGMIITEPAQSPVLPIVSYCLASITMTVVNKVRAFREWVACLWQEKLTFAASASSYCLGDTLL